MSLDDAALRSALARTGVQPKELTRPPDRTDSASSSRSYDVSLPGRSAIGVHSLKNPLTGIARARSDRVGEQRRLIRTGRAEDDSRGT
jgi:hypothetical protein